VKVRTTSARPGPTPKSHALRTSHLRQAAAISPPWRITPACFASTRPAPSGYKPDAIIMPRSINRGRRDRQRLADSPRSVILQQGDQRHRSPHGRSSYLCAGGQPEHVTTLLSNACPTPYGSKTDASSIPPQAGQGRRPCSSPMVLGTDWASLTTAQKKSARSSTPKGPRGCRAGRHPRALP